MAIGVQPNIDCGSPELNVHESKRKASQLDNSKPSMNRAVLI